MTKNFFKVDTKKDDIIFNQDYIIINGCLMFHKTVACIGLDVELLQDKINDKEKNIFLEVVTREVATSNDKELLSMSGSGYTKSEIENDYEVGGALSGYKKLGNTNYFYREM